MSDWLESPIERALNDGDASQIAGLLERGLDPNTTESVTGSPLWEHAFRERRFAIAKEFARRGAEIEKKDREGRTLLHRVVAQSDDAAAVRALADLGADVGVADRFGWTPLHVACAYGYVETVRLLLDLGADARVTTTNGKRPIDMARANYHQSVLGVLGAEQ